MSQEVFMPFSLNADGTIAVTENADTQVRQHVISLVSTEPGERVMLPTYGVPVSSYLFTPNDFHMNDELNEKVHTAVRTWEPGIIVNDTMPIPDANEVSLARIEVQYTRISSIGNPTGKTNTAIIHVGGEVTEYVNG